MYIRTVSISFSAFLPAISPQSNTWAVRFKSGRPTGNQGDQLSLQMDVASFYSCKRKQNEEKRYMYITHILLYILFFFASRSADTPTQRHRVQLKHLKRCLPCIPESPDGLLACFLSLQTSRSWYCMESVSSAADGLWLCQDLLAGQPVPIPSFPGPFQAEAIKQDYLVV